MVKKSKIDAKLKNDRQLRVIDPLIESLKYLKSVATNEGQEFIAYAIEDVILLAIEQRKSK